MNNRDGILHSWLDETYSKLQRLDNEYDEQCECCLLADQAHEHWCPNTEHPTWDNDPDPEARLRHEDLVYRDPRENERRGP